MSLSTYFKERQYLRAEALPLYISLITTLLIVYLLIEFTEKATFQQPPMKVEREFRAAWVASVANINWPSEPGLTVDVQKQEAISILDDLKANNFNAVIFQVRPQADALYQSSLEPWSYYLTGEQGSAPDPLYDPLAFWLTEAHQRGLELHAWLNPYRAHHIKGGEVTEHSVVKTRPELVVQLELGYYWMVPTKQETKDYSFAVVMDIVKRYDIDGIHFDDYFYPYPSYNNGKDFPDQLDYQEYVASGGELTLGDWRRDSVNEFIQRVYEAIKAEKKYVKFGLSPFGIWRPGFPETIKGMDQYEKLYADAKLWLNEGWIDYFVPQLYWQINRYPQSFPLLLNWWEKENTKQRHLWPGIQTNQGIDDRAMDETINQIMIARAMLSDRPGNVFWNTGALKDNSSFSEMLTTGPYKNQALIPSLGWIDNVAPDEPSVSIKKSEDKVVLSWNNNDKKPIKQWVVYLKYDNEWQYQIFNRQQTSIEVALNKPSKDKVLVESLSSEIKPKEAKLTDISVTAIDESGNESSSTVISITEN